jgi:hypothetical protein
MDAPKKNEYEGFLPEVEDFRRALDEQLAACEGDRNASGALKIDTVHDAILHSPMSGMKEGRSADEIIERIIQRLWTIVDSQSVLKLPGIADENGLYGDVHVDAGQNWHQQASELERVVREWGVEQHDRLNGVAKANRESGIDESKVLFPLEDGRTNLAKKLETAGRRRRPR